MTDFPPIGKIGEEFFSEIIYPRLGFTRPEIIVGPRFGCDNGIVRINDDQVLVVTTDPLSIIPALGLEDSAWLSVHLLASDLVTSGIAPQFVSVDLNLPPHITRKEFEIYWEVFHAECQKLGIAVVAGHTGRFLGCDYTIVGGATLMAVGPAEAYLAPGMARAGDRVVLTKGAAIATTGILTRVFSQKVAEECGAEVQNRAAQYFQKFSIVPDALTAVSIGVRSNGVTAMHDATEGGVFGALYELAASAQCGIRVTKGSIPVSEETKRICALFQLDPYRTLSEGSLTIAVRPEKVQPLLDALASQSILAAEVGELTDSSSGMWIVDEGMEEPLTYYEIDPYWKAYADAIEKGWK